LFLEVASTFLTQGFSQVTKNEHCRTARLDILTNLILL